MTLPYENASSGTAALNEVERILRRFGCSNFGLMSDWERGLTMIAFTWRDRRVQMEASWKGYAAMWLKQNPWNPKRKRNPKEHERYAMERGELAVPSILRDWIKGNVTALECGVMTFEEMFMPHMLLPDGTRLIEKVREVVPMLEGPHQ